eukprot:6214282-Pleurochrysis_carterae.AAC.1
MGNNDQEGCISGHRDEGGVEAMTYAEAYEKCDSLGLQLCAQTCAGAGCYYDDQPLWTRVACNEGKIQMPPPPSPSPPHNSAGSKIPANGIQVLDGYTGSLIACVRNENSRYAPGNKPIATQCCTKDEEGDECRRFIGDENGGCISGHDKEGIQVYTYSQAYDKCDKLGMQLCSKSCSGTGCWYDYRPVWTRLECDTANLFDEAPPLLAGAPAPPVAPENAPICINDCGVDRDSSFASDGKCDGAHATAPA